MNDIIAIAKIMRPRSLSKEFQGTVLEMLGTAQSAAGAAGRLVLLPPSFLFSPLVELFSPRLSLRPHPSSFFLLLFLLA